MARGTFDRALPLVLAHEGGYVNHPKDPGGATNKGVTQRVYDAYRKARHLHPRSVKHIIDQEVRDIYRRQYWDAVRGDDLPAGIDYATFDAAVNSGPSRGAKWLQMAAGAGADGIVGQLTIDAAHRAAAAGEEELIADMCGLRMDFVRSLRTWKTFGKGWTRRIMGDAPGVQDHDHGVIDYATMIARGDTAYGMPRPIGAKPGEAAGKADPADVDRARTPEAVGGGLAGLGTGGAVLLDTVPQLQALGDSTLLQGIIAVLVIGGVGLTVWSALKSRREAAA